MYALLSQALTIFFLILPVGFMMVVAVVGIRARLKTIDRIRQLYAEGRYQHWASKEMGLRIRVLSLLSLLVILAFIAVMILTFLSTIPMKNGAILMVGFVAIELVIGFYLQWKVLHP